MTNGLTSEDYIQERVNPQIEALKRQAAFNRKAYLLFRVFFFIVVAVIPVFALSPQPWARLASAIMGFLGLISVGVTSVCGFYRRCEECFGKAVVLEREKFEFMARVGPYAGDASGALAVFVENIESVAE